MATSTVRRRATAPTSCIATTGTAKFTEIAAQAGVAGGALATPSRWGDIDNDGWIDLYVSSYIDKPVNEHDFLFSNVARQVHRHPARAEAAARRDARHPVGGLRSATAIWTSRSPTTTRTGTHALYRNQLPAGRGRAVGAGAGGRRQERATRRRRGGPRLRAGTRTLLGMGIVDSGGGYCSQNVAPVHVGLGRAEPVDIEVTTMLGGRRQTTRVAKVTPGRPCRDRSSSSARREVAPRPLAIDD